MAVPPLTAIIEPLLHVLATASDGLTSRHAQDLVADRLGLSVEERSVRVAGGSQALFRHRTNWAHDRLKRARLSWTPRRGTWQLTAEGLKLARLNADGLTPAVVQQIQKAAHGARLPESAAVPA